MANALVQRRSVPPHSAEWGVLFENFIHNEIKAYLSYAQSKKVVQFWRSTSKLEVDFVVRYPGLVDDLCGIEVKATVSPTSKHANGLRALNEEFPKIKKLIVCLCESPLALPGEITALPVDIFLKELWSGRLIARED